MKYAYFPGCSLSHSASAYQDSFEAVLTVLAQELVELDDWNCCGATEYFSINPLPAYALVARNLALVPDELDNLVAPCSACYVNLLKTDAHMQKYAQLDADVNQALAEAHMHYQAGSVKVRHALDIIYTDVGCELVEACVKRPLTNLRLAPYYGCLVTRPDYGYDDPEYPTSLDELLNALGATVVDYPLKTDCCGGHMPQISPETAYELLHALLLNAQEHEADALVVTCPMCHLNLDAFQSQVNRHFGLNFNMPVLYFTQVMGLAFGLSRKELGFGQELVSTDAVFKKLESPPDERESAPPKKRRDKQALPMPRMY